jgi:hypothetical protein
MGKKQIYILFAIALVLFGISVYIYINEDKEKKDDFNDNIKYKKVDNTIYSNENVKANESNSTTNIKSPPNTPGTSTSGSSSSVAPESPSSPPIQKSLPSDISTSPCGFYYEGYEVCTGYCAVGSCISEGRSCYCKITY